MKGIKQHDIRDCGAACLATILLYHKLKVPLVYIREKMKVDKNGASIFSIIKVAEEYFLKGTALSGTMEELQESIRDNSIKLPCIIHVVNCDSCMHFIVAYKITDNKIFCFDPAIGVVNYSLDKFDEIWTGYIISFEKHQNFKKGNLRRGQYKKYFEIVLKQKKMFALVIGFSIFIAVLSIISSLAYQQIVDCNILGNDYAYGENSLSYNVIYRSITEQLNILFENIGSVFLAMICIYIIQAGLGYARSFFTAQITKKSLKILTLNYCRHLLSVPIYYFTDRETGEIISRFNDINQIQEIIFSAICSIFLNIFMAFAGGIVLASINLKLFYIVLIIVSLYILTIFMYKGVVGRVSREVMESDARVISKLKEGIDSIETIKAFTYEKKFYSVFKERIWNYTSNLYKGMLIYSSQSIVLGLIEGIGLIVILWKGSNFALNGEISLGTLIAFQSLVYFFLSPIIGIIGLQPQLQQAFIAADRLNDIMEIAPEENETHTSLTSKNCVEERIVFSNVSFHYGYGRNVLNRISFEIKAKEKIAIVGKSGCGKSTILKMLSKYYIPSEGQIFLDNIDIKNIFAKEIRNKIIYISQKNELFTGSLEENLLIGNSEINKDKFEDIIAGCCLKEVINKLPMGLKSEVSEGGKGFSEGEKQRIAIARALIANPDVILFDESTSSMDRDLENQILSYIWSNYNSKTCIFVAHRVNVIEKCNKVIFIKDGEIECVGNHKVLVDSNKAYKDLIQITR